MLTSRIFQYASGTVRIRITGEAPERFVNLCLVRGIDLWGVTQEGACLYACMRLKDFFQIRPLVRMSRIRVEVTYFRGMPFVVKRWRRRKVFLAGAILSLFLLNYLASFIWSVDVVGAKQVPSAAIREIVYACGIKPGGKKDAIDCRGAENAVLFQMPEITWVSVGVRGTHVVVEIVEKTLPRQEDKSPADIVAAKDGVITELIVVAGQAVAKKGDTVHRGDLLIRGVIPPPAAPESALSQTVESPVRAAGIVKARVWYEGYGEGERVKRWATRTGKIQRDIRVIIAGSEWALYTMMERPFSFYEVDIVRKTPSLWRNTIPGVELIIHSYYELESHKTEISPEEAFEQAKARALASIQSGMPENAHILLRHVEPILLNETGLVRVKASVETIEEIGQTAKHTL